jgi:Carboxypeptidase regulatory-like domain
MQLLGALSAFRKAGSCITLVLFFSICVAAAFGQEATIVGTVTDPTGAVIPKVTITITSEATLHVRTLATNEAGQYVAPDLPIGKYDVKAEASGFLMKASKGVVLNVSDRVRVDFQMQVGTNAQTVTVEADAVHVQTDSGEQQSLVNGTQITELATNGRTIYSYVVLTPGAVGLNPDTQIPVPTGPMGAASGNISFNGNRPGHNLYLLDGGENSDRGGAGSSSVLPSIDAMAETETLTSNYSAEYGISSGGTISSVIKSGTDKYHAEAWEFFRNDALDARNFFNPAPQPVGELRYNIFGFNASGPVPIGQQHKTFFFYNMEWRRIVSGGTPINQTVPDPGTYGGAFSSSLAATALHTPCTNQVSPALAAKFAAAGQTLSTADAKTGNCDDSNGDAAVLVPFTNNTITASLLDPNAQALLHAGGKYGGIFPTPTNGLQFQAPVNEPTNVREEIVRIDENLNSKFTIFGHFIAEQIFQNVATSMWSNDNVPSVGNTFDNPSYAGVVHAAYVISPSLVNEVAFNYNGNRIAITPTGLYAQPSSYTGTRFFSGPNVDNRIPSIDLAGSTGSNYTVNWMPWNNTANSYQLRDDVSWTRGRHQLRIGGGWLYYLKAQDWFKLTEGTFTFNGQYTGNDFADFLLGLAQNYTEDAIKSTGHWNNQSWALYFQDNYRVNNRLTLNLGLRWDGLPHTYEANKQMANFYPSLYSSSAAAILNPDGNTINPASPGLGPSPNPILAGQQFYLNGIAICGTNGVPVGCVNGGWKNFGPRIGFAYDLTGSGKTVIRGGYGIMYERLQGNDVYNNAGTVPLSASINFNNVLLSDPRTNVATGSTLSTSIPVNNITGLDGNNYTPPRSSQFSLGIQHSIGKSVLSLSYVGTQNRFQNYYTETNLPNAALLPGLVANSAPYNFDVQYLGYHQIRMAQDEANGDYNSLQASLRGSLKTDLTYQLGYTYAHSNDLLTQGNSAGDLGNITNPYAGWKYDFGPSPFDIRNLFFTNFVYQVPFMRHSDSRPLRTTFGGWELSGIVTVQSGAPLDIGLTGNNVASIIPFGSNRPNQSGIANNPHTVTAWFDTSIYSAPAAGTWGNTPADSVRGPGRDSWNLSLFKNFALSDDRGSNLQFRAEFFNIWNHTQFVGNAALGGISTNFGASNFGQVTSAYDPRIIQLALKLQF